jgi:hypothetical protein
MADKYTVTVEARPEAPYASNIRGLHCQTALLGHIGTIGLFGAVSNRYHGSKRAIFMAMLLSAQQHRAVAKLLRQKAAMAPEQDRQQLERRVPGEESPSGTGASDNGSVNRASVTR